jgi:hypothetical protein
MGDLYAGVIIGLTGTALKDVWAIFLKRVFDNAPPNWAMVGRWVVHLKSGKVFNDDIAEALAFSSENLVGWIFYYFVGFIYGVIFMLLVGKEWLSGPTLMPVWLYSISTILVGWFLLHPGLGLGMALAKTENPFKGRCMGLMTHSVFGLGMWFGAFAI